MLADTTHWDLCRLQTVTPDPAADRTFVTWAGGLPGVQPENEAAPAAVQVWAFRHRAALFGANAPDWRAMPDTIKHSYSTAILTEWPQLRGRH